MTNPALLLQYGLIYGVVLGTLMCIVFIGLTFFNPEIWLKDYPPDIQQKHGPMSEEALRQRTRAGVPVLALLLGTVIFALVQLRQALGAPLSFVDVLVCVFLILSVFNVMDLLILDWLLFVTVQPRIIVLPGTEGAPGYKDYGFHLRAFFKGLAGSALASLAVAAFAMAAQSFSG